MSDDFTLNAPGFGIPAPKTGFEPDPVLQNVPNPPEIDAGAPETPSAGTSLPDESVPGPSETPVRETKGDRLAPRSVDEFFSAEDPVEFILRLDENRKRRRAIVSLESDLADLGLTPDGFGNTAQRYAERRQAEFAQFNADLINADTRRGLMASGADVGMADEPQAQAAAAAREGQRLGGRLTVEEARAIAEEDKPQIEQQLQEARQYRRQAFENAAKEVKSIQQMFGIPDEEVPPEMRGAWERGKQLAIGRAVEGSRQTDALFQDMVANYRKALAGAVRAAQDPAKWGPKYTRLVHYTNAFTSSAGNMGFGISKGLVILGEMLTDPDLSEGKSSARQALDDMQQRFNEALPVDSYWAQTQFFLTDLAQAGGSMSVFLMGGMVAQTITGSAKAGGWAAGILGSMVESSALFEEAERYDASMWEKYFAYLSGLGIGATEALPISQMLARANARTGGSVMRALMERSQAGFASFVENSLQEFGQNMLHDLTAKVSFDPIRTMNVNQAVREGIAGGASGMLLQMIMPGVGRRTPPPPAVDNAEVMQRLQAEVDFGAIQEQFDKEIGDAVQSTPVETSIVEEVAAPPAAAAEEPGPSIPSIVSGEPIEVQPDGTAGTHMFDPTKIEADPKRFQFREGGDEFGVTGVLASVTQWRRERANQIIVWRDKSGKDFVVDGHQRLGLAKKLLAEGRETDIQIPGVLLREEDGIDAEKAMEIASLKNIAEGTASPIDAAKVIRAAGPEALQDLPISRDAVRSAVDLSKLSLDAWRMVVNDVVPAMYAKYVGRYIDTNDTDRQTAAMNALAKANVANQDEAAILVRRVAEAELAKAEAGAQGSMFEDLDTPDSTVMEEVRIVSRAVQIVGRDKNLFSRVMRNAERLEQAGTEIDRVAAQNVISAADQLKTEIEKLAFRSGAVRDVLTRIARELHDGSIKLGQAAEDFVDQIRAGEEGTGDAGAQDGSGRGDDELAGDEQAGLLYQRVSEERGADDRQQLVIPGAEQVGQGEQAQRRADQPLRPRAEQKPMDFGLFGETAPQGDLFSDDQSDLLGQAVAEPPAMLDAEGRSAWQALQSDSFDLDEMEQHPAIVKATADMEAIDPVHAQPGYASEEWEQSRVFNIDGEEVVGYDAAIEKFKEHAGQLAAKELGIEPYEVAHDKKAVIVIGPPAAGKSTIANVLAVQMKAAIPDSDEVKKTLPEYAGGIGASAVHEESADINAIVQAELLMEGANVIIPKVGDNAAKMEAFIGQLREMGYDVTLTWMNVEPSEAMRRMYLRFFKSGRLINPKYARMAGVKPPETYAQLKAKGAANGFVEIQSPRGSSPTVAETTSETIGLQQGQAIALGGPGDIRTGFGDGDAEGRAGDILAQEVIHPAVIVTHGNWKTAALWERPLDARLAAEAHGGDWMMVNISREVGGVSESLYGVAILNDSQNDIVKYLQPDDIKSEPLPPEQLSLDLQRRQAAPPRTLPEGIDESQVEITATEFSSQGGRVRQAAVGERSRPSMGIPEGPSMQAGDDVSISQMSNNLDRLMGLVVRQGRLTLKGQGILGQYQRSTGVIRMRDMSDLSTRVHEAAHALHDARSEILNRFILDHRPEMQAIADNWYGGQFQTEGQRLREGFAEFFRIYTMARGFGTQQGSPNYIPGLADMNDAFDTLLSQNAPELLRGVDMLRDQFERWLSIPSTEAVKSMIVTTKRKGIIGTAIEQIRDKDIAGNVTFRGTGSWLDDKLSRLYKDAIDSQDTLRRTVDGLLNESERNNGTAIDLPHHENPAVLLALSRHAAGPALIELKYGVRGYRSTQTMSPALRDAIQVAMGERPGTRGRAAFDQTRLGDFDAYLVARRALAEYERYRMGEIPNPPLGGNIREGDAQQTIRDLEARYGDAFRDAAEMVYEYNRALWQKIHDAGLIDDELYALGVAKQDYVPLMRDMSDKGKAFGESFITTGKARIVKRFKGSGRDVLSPLESIMNRTFAYEKLIAANEVRLALVRLGDKVGPGSGKYVERIPAHEMRAQQINVLETMREALKDPTIDPVDAQEMAAQLESAFDDTATVTRFRPSETTPAGEHIVFFYENGKRKAMQVADGEVGEDLMQLLSGIGKENLPLGLDMLAFTSNAFRAGITSWPDFIAVNFFRDQLQTWLQQEKFIPFLTGARGVVDEVAQNKAVQDYNALGGIMGGMINASLHDARVKHDLQALRDKGYVANVVGDVSKVMKGDIRSLAKGMAKFSELSESGTRVGLFRKAYEKYRADGLSDYEAGIAAAYIAVDNMNFSRSGSRMLVVRRLVPFLNAQIQGLDKMWRTLSAAEGGRRRKGMSWKLLMGIAVKDMQGMGLNAQEQQNLKIARKAWRKMMFMSLISMAIAAALQDDEDYQQGSAYLKATGWFIPGPDGNLMWLPKPFEWAVLGNFLEAAYGSNVGDGRAMERFREGLSYTMIPPHDVPVLNVARELYFNIDTFREQPIVPFWMERFEAHEQYDAYTSEIAKAIGREMNWSPLKVDHFIKNMFASAGRDFLAESSNLLDPNKPQMGLEDHFFTRRWVRDSKRGSTIARDFWDYMSGRDGAFAKASATFNKKMDDGRSQDAADFLQKLEPNEQVYVLLNHDRPAAEKRLHPMRYARDFSSVISEMRREIISGDGLQDTTFKDDPAEIQMTAKTKALVEDLLSEMNLRNMRNVLVLMGDRGWAHRDMLPTDESLGLLLEIQPQVADELERRLTDARVYDWGHVRDTWPELRDRMLQGGEEENIRDLTIGAKR